MKNIIRKPKEFWNGFKTEFGKIVWASRDQLFDEFVMVSLISVVLGIFIVILDLGIQYGIDFLLTIGA